MRGFELLKTRKINDKVDIDSLEKEHGITLPEKYRLFCETFYLGSGAIYEDKYINPQNPDLPLRCSFFEYVPFEYMPSEPVSLSKLLRIDQSLEFIKEAEEWLDHDLLPIGVVSWNGALVVGLSGANYDKVILHNIELEPHFEVLANNIFEFIRGLQLTPINQNDLVRNITFSQLYRNWGEDFWRVREEG